MTTMLWQKVPKEELEELYKKFGMRKIATILDSNKEAVRYALHFHEIPVRRQGCWPPYLRAESLVDNIENQYNNLPDDAKPKFVEELEILAVRLRENLTEEE